MPFYFYFDDNNLVISSTPRMGKSKHIHLPKVRKKKCPICGHTMQPILIGKLSLDYSNTLNIIEHEIRCTNCGRTEDGDWENPETYEIKLEVDRDTFIYRYFFPYLPYSGREKILILDEWEEVFLPNNRIEYHIYAKHLTTDVEEILSQFERREVYVTLWRFDTERKLVEDWTADDISDIALILDPSEERILHVGKDVKDYFATEEEILAAIGV